MSKYPKSTICSTVSFKQIKTDAQTVSVATGKKRLTEAVIAGSGPASKAPVARVRQLTHPGVLE